MRQDWHHLLFLHWAIPADRIQQLLPPSLEVDTFDGNAYVGLIPFTLTGVRPYGGPILPFVSRFHEVNVRTYVHHKGKDPGVWFFSLDASSPLAVAGARLVYKLPYFRAHMNVCSPDRKVPVIDFHSERDTAGTPATCSISYSPREGPVAPASPGTIDHFLVERYILYARSEDRLYRARVHHQPYPLQQANVSKLEETMIWAAGIQRSENAPITHYAHEVNVRVYPLERVK